MTGVSYSWLSSSFSEGDFKTLGTREEIGKTVQSSILRKDESTNVSEEQTSSKTQGPLYSCPKEGCIRVFQRQSALDRHLSLEACELKLEKHSLLDSAKVRYAYLLEKGGDLFPSLPVPSTNKLSQNIESPAEGWALKEVKKAYRFNERQKEYLQAKFYIGQTTGRKLDPEVVAKEMRRARSEDGSRLFGVTEFLTS